MAQTKRKMSYSERRSLLNARNRQARARRGRVTGPQVWCAYPHDRVKCGRCGPRVEYTNRPKGSAVEIRVTA